MTKPRALGTFCLASAALLSACSFTPSYERPVAPVPTGYATSESATTPATRAAQIPWKEYFKDQRLQQLIDIALESNRDLRVAALNIEQARAQFQIRRADQLPSVGWGVNASRGPAPSTGNLTNSFSVGLALSAWELDVFGRIASLKEQALAQYLATQEAQQAVQISLVGAVATGWLNLLADEELLGLTRKTLASREDSVRLMRLRMDAGVASELDYRQAESLLQTARATLAQQQRQRALDENALALLLGQAIPDDIRATLGGKTLADAPVLQPIPAGLPSSLLEDRPDIRQAESLLKAANANVGAARAAFFPRIALTAQAGTTSSELSALFSNGSWGFSIAPSLLLPIFDGGRNQANLEAVQAARSIAVAQYEKSIQVAFKEVSDALAGQATLSEQVAALREQVRQESARLELAQLRYNNGVSSSLDLLDAQRSLFAAQQMAVSAHLLQLQNQISLYKALGGGASAPTAETTTATAAPIR